MDSTIREQREERAMEQEESDGSSYISASVSEYSDVDMCEEYYE